MTGRLDKVTDLMRKVALAIRSGSYIVTNHAYERSRGRRVPLNHVEHVLLNGFHEKKKDKFDEAFKSWNYSVRGKSPDDVNVRVVVSFEEDDLLIITIINLDV